LNNVIRLISLFVCRTHGKFDSVNSKRIFLFAAFQSASCNADDGCHVLYDTPLTQHRLTHL